MSINLNIPYSQQYAALNLEGHEHPPPSFGAPTLIWHIGLSPHWDERQIDSKKELNEIHATLSKDYETTRTTFFRDVNRLLERLQTAAGFPALPNQRFDPEHVPAPWKSRAHDADEPFYVAKPGSIRFTLWWSDSNKRPDPEPADDALRVKVHAGAHRDYVTLSFYLDAAKPWNGSPQTTASAPNGKRRQDILTNTDRVRAICEARMVGTPRAGVRSIARSCRKRRPQLKPRQCWRRAGISIRAFGASSAKPWVLMKCRCWRLAAYLLISAASSWPRMAFRNR